MTWSNGVSCRRIGRAADEQVLAGADPVAGGELLEQRAIEATWRAVIGVLDHRAVPQSCLAQPMTEAFVFAARRLTIYSRPSQSSREISSATAVRCISRNASAMAARPRPRMRSAMGWISMGSPFNDSILSSHENPKICGIDDAEVVGDLIAVDMPIPRHLLA